VLTPQGQLDAAAEVVWRSENVPIDQRNVEATLQSGAPKPATANSSASSGSNFLLAGLALTGAAFVLGAAPQIRIDPSVPDELPSEPSVRYRVSSKAVPEEVAAEQEAIAAEEEAFEQAAQQTGRRAALRQGAATTVEGAGTTLQTIGAAIVSAGSRLTTFIILPANWADSFKPPGPRS
jgi:hypothetical protein